jgi:MinD-like ATPase involved in chromosome partitioning or flagellar assembly
LSKLTIVAKKFLNINIAEVGSMKKDWRVEKALTTQEPFVLKYSKAGIVRSMYDIANFFIKKSHQANISESRIKSIFRQQGSS